MWPPVHHSSAHHPYLCNGRYLISTLGTVPPSATNTMLPGYSGYNTLAEASHITYKVDDDVLQCDTEYIYTKGKIAPPPVIQLDNRYLHYISFIGKIEAGFEESKCKCESTNKVNVHLMESIISINI